MRLQVKLIIIFFLFIGCSKSPILTIDYTGEQPKQITPQQAFDPSHAYHQITTHPEIDAYPSISPDGFWIAFASLRSGNMDIWIKPIKGGSAVQITNHRADDIMPAWSPDSRKIIFVSYREDAAGDLWMVPIKKNRDKFSLAGGPKKLTNYLGMDVTPAFSPDGKYIAFTSDRDGKHNIYLYQVANKKVIKLTAIGGIHPSWSRDKSKIAFISYQQNPLNRGQIYFAELSFSGREPTVINYVKVTSGQSNDAFPCWNPTKDEIFFSRYDQDSNGDGQITPDDKPGLWKAIIEPQASKQKILQQFETENKVKEATNRLNSQYDINEIQLIPTYDHDYFPVHGRGAMLYFVSNRSGNDDLWQIPADGVIPRQGDGFLQYQFALNYFPLPANDLIFKLSQESKDKERNLYRLLAFQRVIDFFPAQSTWVEWSLYEIGRTYLALDRPDFAAAYFQEIVDYYSSHTELTGKAKLRLFELGFRNKNFDAQITVLDEIIEQNQGKNELVAEANLFKGEAYYLSKNYSFAIESFEQLISSFPEEQEKCAVAQLLIGDIYGKFGQTEGVISAFTRVLKNYPLQQAWGDSALNRILALERGSDFSTMISSYRYIISRYSENRRLAARAQLKIGELFFERNDYDVAIEELSFVEKKYPDQRYEMAQAELLLARVFEKKAEDLRAISQYKKLINELTDVQSGLFVVKAKEQLLELYLRTGRQFQRVGEMRAANNRFREAITIFPRHLDAHRGYVATIYALGKIDLAIQIYQNLLSSNQENEVIIYILGLCYSYKATELSDRTKNIEHLDMNSMFKSNKLIQQALSKNYRLIQAYLTLSFNYESIEKHESALRAKDRGFLVSFIRTAVAPVKSLIYWITFQKEKTPEHYYELAIEALTTAISLNNERENPVLESELALNLAGNYYNLGEFGFEQAYKYYQEKINFDSTFTSKKLEADVYKRIGHCALVVEDFKQGPVYLQRAINLYKDLDDKENWLLNIKRLALLYQLAGDYDSSSEYFKVAVAEDGKKQRYNQQASAYRSIAYNYQMLDAEDEAVRYAKKSLELIEAGKVEEVKAEPNWIKLGILGVEFPVWKLGQFGAGASTAAEGFTTNEERAFIYSIMGNAALEQRSIKGAIHYLNEKIIIYQKRKDRIAEAIFLNNIGYLHYVDLNYSTAWDYFERSLKICKKELNTPGALINILNLATLGIVLNKMQALHMEFPMDNSSPDNVTKYLASSEDNLQLGLSLYENEQVGFLHEKVQLYNLLGNLYSLKNLHLSDSKKNDQIAVIQNQLYRLENLAVADSCFQIAQQIASENNFQLEQIVVLQNQGYLSLELGDFNNVQALFDQARTLAIQNNFQSWLWRIDLALGQIRLVWDDSLSQPVPKRDANFYLDEAISIVEKNALQLHTFRAKPLYSYQIRTLYQTAIDYNISQKKMIHALRLTEQYRGKQYLDMIGSHKLELRRERHKLAIGNVRFFNEELIKLDNRIRQARVQGNYMPQEMAAWTSERQKLQVEYLKALKDLTAEDPELESFIQVEPATFVQVQNILDKNSIVVNYFISNMKLYIWTITADSVNFIEVPLQENQFAKQVEMYVASFMDNSLSEHFTKTIWQSLIQPIKSQLDSFKIIIIIPDESINRIPLSYLLNFSVPENRQLKNVVMAPSLSNYYFSFEKRKIRHYEVLLGAVNDVQKIKDIGYQAKKITVNEKEQSALQRKLKDQLQGADIIYLNIKYQPEKSDPLLSTLILQMPQKYPSFQVRQTYNFDLKCSLVILNGLEVGDISTQIALQRAILYAGAPSLIISLWDCNDTIFLEYFFDLLFEYSVADAFLRAQLKMQKAGFDPYVYAGYQLIGFEGMDDEQELQFAEQRFVSTVRRGNFDAENKKWQDAIAEYEQALVMARKRGDEQAINNLYQFIIETSISGGLFEKAINYQLEALESAKVDNDIQKIAECFVYLVFLYTENKNFDQAVLYQNEYLRLVEQHNIKPEMAKSYRDLGLVYERGGNYDKALDNFSQAIEIYREIGDSVSIGTCFNDRGRIYFMNRDNYSKAIENQQQALQIFQAQQNIQGTIEALQNLGQSHERLANLQMALNYQAQALQLAKQLNDTSRMALSQHLLANVYWKMGNYELALRFEQQAQQFFKGSGNLKLQSVSLVTEGLILMSLGNLEGAIEKQQQALELAERINDRLDMANIYKNLGLIYRAQNRWDDALAQFQQAIQIDELIDSKRGLGYGYRDIGSIYLQQGITDKALIYFHKALNLSGKIFDGRNEAQCLYEIGKTYLFLENQQAAIDTLTLAVRKAKELFIPEVEWRSHRLIGQLSQENKNWQESIGAYHEALRIIEAMRSQIKVEEFKSGFIDDKLVVYHDLVELYLQLDQPGKALEIVERAKSRNFIDLLANRDIKFSGKVSEEKLIKGEQLENEIRRIQNEISGLMVKGSNITSNERENLDNLDKKLEVLKQQYQQFLIEIKSQSAELAEMVTVEPPDFDSLRIMLPDSVIMLEYFYTNDKFYSWAVANNKIVSQKQDFQASELITLVDSLRKSLQEQKSILSISQQLYRLLIKPYESELRYQGHIVIIPHGILHYLPFAALLDNDQRYLIEKFSISLAPGATVLKICMEKGEPYVSTNSWTEDILALGNPDLNNAQLELPFAEKEVESVKLLYPKVNSYLYQKATETNFKQLCDKPNIFLLSCHGEFDATNPLFSSLLLTSDEQNDGRLNAYEIFELKMNAYLVAMSACETGLAKVSVGDEVIGLSRSFIYAGSSSLLSSLWKVDDLATAVMIKRFFRYLKEGQSRARALQKAIDLVRTQINVHPVYWAAFNITGDFR